MHITQFLQNIKQQNDIIFLPHNVPILHRITPFVYYPFSTNDNSNNFRKKDLIFNKIEFFSWKIVVVENTWSCFRQPTLLVELHEWFCYLEDYKPWKMLTTHKHFRWLNSHTCAFVDKKETPLKGKVSWRFLIMLATPIKLTKWVILRDNVTWYFVCDILWNKRTNAQFFLDRLEWLKVHCLSK